MYNMCEISCDDVDMANVNENFQGLGFDIVYMNRDVLSRFNSGITV